MSITDVYSYELASFGFLCRTILIVACVSLVSRVFSVLLRRSIFEIIYVYSGLLKSRYIILLSILLNGRLFP